MLLTPRTYSLAQIPDRGQKRAGSAFFVCGTSRKEEIQAIHEARRMLLLHQAGSVKVGEVVRYTVTYTPSADRILPSPAHLHVKIKNTSSVALRAAYLHGPYTVHVAAYPASFNPNHKLEHPARDGVPEFEPNVKPGGSWNARLTVPEDIRETGGPVRSAWGAETEPKSATWIIEIASQILFSSSASVSYELLVARDERSLELSHLSVTGNLQHPPGHIKDHVKDRTQPRHGHDGSHSAQIKGVYSKAIKLIVEDTAALWNKPELPEWDGESDQTGNRRSTDGLGKGSSSQTQTMKKKRVHLVVLTHGLHSNLGADMLYLKESIDAATKEAREESRKRKEAERAKEGSVTPSPDTARTAGSKSHETPASSVPLSAEQHDLPHQSQADLDYDDDEMVVVRGFPKNVMRTERGIKYLGKRLAKYILEMTYPDQPFLPVKRSVSQKLSDKLAPSGSKPSTEPGIPIHSHSTIQQPKQTHGDRAYRFTSISFVSHSLGGLVQTYAIAYIQKHSPQFFELITPVNFIALASPFLGLSNENPVYVKMALEMGLVGRTGQDLGLTWTTPTVVRSGWSAVLSGLGAQKDQTQEDPRAKPLLRILPTGPAHSALRRFRNRTVYSNVVNDGIVPLRTSCLLFLDWRGLGRVEKARRENGLIGTVAEWGWSNLTGQNTPSPFSPLQSETSPRPRSGYESPPYTADESAVPQPAEDVTNEDDKVQTANVATPGEPAAHQFLDSHHRGESRESVGSTQSRPAQTFLQSAHTISKFLSFLQPSGAHTAKDTKMFRRSQTILSGPPSPVSAGHSITEPSAQPSPATNKRPPATRGDSIGDDSTHVAAPPKTTIFESAGDLLNPPVPPTSWILDPKSRARTIFHDRVYHPEDIPPPPAKRPNRFSRSFSSQDSTPTIRTLRSDEGVVEDAGGMRVEEKIARAYHKDLSWRKVLVRLEPDAHNNIIVRRMFANAYGWPVIKHLCDTHFAETYTALTRDELEPATDRAKAANKRAGTEGEEVKGQHDLTPRKRSRSEMRESADELAPLQSPTGSLKGKSDRPKPKREDTSLWDDAYFEGSSDSDSDTGNEGGPLQKMLPLQRSKKGKAVEAPFSPTSPDPSKKGTSSPEIADFLTMSPPPIEGHRGLAPTPSISVSVPTSPPSRKSFEGVNGKAMVHSGSPESSKLIHSNTSDVGLKKKIGDAMPKLPSEGQDRSEGASGGVGELVTRLSFSKDRS